MDILKKSLQILNKNILFPLIYTSQVIPIVLLESRLLKDSLLSFVFIALLAGLYFLFICGSYSALWEYTQKGKYNFFEGIKKNAKNYFVASIVWVLISMTSVPLYIIFVIFYSTVLKLPDTIFGIIITLISASILPTTFLIYTNPYVFTNEKDGEAPIESIKYAIKNFKISLYPASISVLSFVFLSLVRIPMSIGKNINSYFFIPILITFISAYLLYLSFLTACFILNKKRERGP